MKKKTQDQLDSILEKHEQSYSGMMDSKGKKALKRLSITEKYEQFVAGVIWPIMKDFEIRLESKGHTAMINKRSCTTAGGREYTGAITLVILPSGMEGTINDFSAPHIEFFLDEDGKRVLIVTQVRNMEGRSDFLPSIRVKLNMLNPGKVEFYIMRGIREIFNKMKS